MKIKTCVDCSCEFIIRSSSQKRCPNCAHIHRAEKRRIDNEIGAARRKAAMPPLMCIRCGQHFDRAARSRAKYCPECRLARQTEGAAIRDAIEHDIPGRIWSNGKSGAQASGYTPYPWQLWRPD